MMAVLRCLACSLLLTMTNAVLASEPPEPSLKPQACENPPPGMQCIPGGLFLRGSDSDQHVCKQRFGETLRYRPNARPSAQVWLETFYMDIFEVTYAEFAACIKAKTCSRRPADNRWGPRYTDFSRPRQPITGVSWYQAVEYCQWKGKSLPTEAQWEKAARGPDGEQHPWGNEPATCERAVIKDPKLGRSWRRLESELRAGRMGRG
jgi:sulfatase modifying factor 1